MVEFIPVFSHPPERSLALMKQEALQSLYAALMSVRSQPRMEMAKVMMMAGFMVEFV